jgi:pimeloyl-ACP methyl ester carboxylesterase
VSFVDRDGVRVHYQVFGPATGRLPLLLTHGFAASAAMWQPNLAGLAASRPVITWDLRGHGRTGGPDDPVLYSEPACVADMAGVLDACGFDQAAIGGQSLGGYLSLAFHLAHPERVAALLLFDTGPGFRRDDARERWNERAHGIASRLDQHGLAALPGAPESQGAQHDASALAHAARGMLTQRDASVIDSLASVTVPALVLAGAADQSFLAAADYMAARIPGAVQVLIPGAGHAANIDQPQLFNQAVLAFLEGSGCS